MFGSFEGCCLAPLQNILFTPPGSVSRKDASRKAISMPLRSSSPRAAGSMEVCGFGGVGRKYQEKTVSMRTCCIPLDCMPWNATFSAQAAGNSLCTKAHTQQHMHNCISKPARARQPVHQHLHNSTCTKKYGHSACATAHTQKDMRKERVVQVQFVRDSINCACCFATPDIAHRLLHVYSKGRGPAASATEEGCAGKRL
eukprot:1160434-Pelagomonas_calceolata.AAC.4